MRPLEVIPAQDLHGEAPLWNVNDGRLWWSDIHGRRLHRYDPRTGSDDILEMPDRLCAFAFIEGDDHRIVAGFADGIGFLDTATLEMEWIARPEIHTGRRFNDGRVDRAGRFWIGTMIEDERAGTASAALWRLDANGAFAPQFDGVRISNGLCASPDGCTLYFADSPCGVIDAFELDPASGRLGKRRPFATLERGEPDGSTIDSEGCLWNASWGAGEIARYSPDGERLRTISLPVSQPSCVAFGGDGLRTLYVTTSRLGLDDTALTREPLAGNLFAYDVGIAGLPESRFRPC
jgi:sugar lactone lactonase YvrE